MNKNLIAGCVALIVAATAAAPAMADSAADLAAAQAQIDTLKQQLDRLEATVDYLNANALAERKETAVTDADVSKLKDTAARYTWSGDFRYRHELIDVANDNLSPDHTRQRERIRVRFGVLAKVNDQINARLQFSTTNSGSDSARSTNQTLGTSWDKKPLSIDLAYVEWKPNPMVNVQLGKTPLPWTTTASYFWDKDLTAEGAAFRFTRGPFFAGAYYDWLNERNVSSSQAASADATMAGFQVGFRQSFGNSTLTAAAAYFDLNGVQDQIVKYNQTLASTGTVDPVTGVVTSTITTTTCTIDGAFGNGYGTGDNSFGNTTYTGAAPQVGSSTACTRLLSDFNIITGLVQFDTKIGAYPFSVFVDYMKNNAAKVNTTAGVNRKLDSASAIGFTFNKAGAPRTWEFSTVYEQNGKDAVFGQYVDSDFGGGVTDAKGFSFKGAWVPAANWTLNGTYFLNKLNYDGVASSSTKHELDYKRVQLDLNYKY